jgi:nucleotide-binding universal stress UspA family protein
MEAVMSGWKEICCACDFSESSRVALETAADLARRFDARLTIVHTRLAETQAASDVLVSSRGVARAEAEVAAEELARWRGVAEARAGAPVRSSLLAGDPATEIVRFARENRCDLLVLGTHGRVGLPRMVLGSVAERVVRRSGCPVLVARPARA